MFLFRFLNQNDGFLSSSKYSITQLLKKPSIEFYETQDLSSPNGKPKLLFYDVTFFSPANCRGELCIAIERVHFLRSEVNRTHEVIQALPADSVYELAHFRSQLRGCCRSLRFWRQKAHLANREWLATMIGN